MPTGGAEGARAALENFWRQRVARRRVLSPFRRSPLDVLLGRWTLDYSPMFVAMDMMSRVFSPYDLNPSGANPLRDILAEASISTGWRARRSSSSSPPPMSAPDAAGSSATPRSRPDVLLASACLPTMFQAIEIDGESYWDGGYSGNPTITPLVRECDSHDTILVQINPVERPGTPRIGARHPQPAQRGLVQRRAAEGAADDGAAAPGRGPRQIAKAPAGPDMRIHRVASDVMVELGYSSKLNAEWDFLSMLRDEGRRAAQAFLTRTATTSASARPRSRRTAGRRLTSWG